MSKHRVALLKGKGKTLEVTDRLTPTAPGPNEVLVQVKAIALNPVDHIMRDTGWWVKVYPAVLGSDVAGTVLAVGSSVTNVKVGTRVCGYAPAFFVKGKPDYGAFQEKVLVPMENVCPLPEQISFMEACLLPMAVQTVWTGFVKQLNLTPESAKFNSSEKRGILVWGAGGSIGSMAVQVAKSCGLTVYATASSKHHEYLTKLGASRIFDYKDKDAVDKIVKAAKEDGISLQIAFDAAGALKECTTILNQMKPKDSKESARLSVAPFKFGLFWWKLFPKWRGVEANFVEPWDVDSERNAFFKRVYVEWLPGQLASGNIVPSPKVKVVEGGLTGIESAMQELKKGVSGVKLVVIL